MARARSFTSVAGWRSRWRAVRWRRVGVLAAISLALSLGVVLYLFGWTDHFATRLLTAFWVSFCLLAVTFLGILPFIGWAATHWFGPGWATGVDGAAPRRAAAAPRAPRPTSSTLPKTV